MLNNNEQQCWWLTTSSSRVWRLPHHTVHIWSKHNLLSPFQTDPYVLISTFSFFFLSELFSPADNTKIMLIHIISNWRPKEFFQSASWSARVHYNCTNNSLVLTWWNSPLTEWFCKNWPWELFPLLIKELDATVRSSNICISV